MLKFFQSTFVPANDPGTTAGNTRVLLWGIFITTPPKAPPSENMAAYYGEASRTQTPSVGMQILVRFTRLSENNFNIQHSIRKTPCPCLRERAVTICMCNDAGTQTLTLDDWAHLTRGGEYLDASASLPRPFFYRCWVVLHSIQNVLLLPVLLPGVFFYQMVSVDTYEIHMQFTYSSSFRFLV